MASGPTPAVSRAQWRERRRSGRYWASAPLRCSSKPLARQSWDLSPFHNPSMMSSFSNGPRISRRERSHEPTASTNVCGPPPQWQRRTNAGSRCPGSTPARAVLPQITRPHLGTGASALLPAPEKHRRPRPSVHAYLRRFCRKFCAGGREEAIALGCGGITRPRSRTVQPQ